MFDDIPSYSPEQLGFTELSARIPADEVMGIRLIGDN